MEFPLQIEKFRMSLHETVRRIRLLQNDSLGVQSEVKNVKM